MTTDGDQKMELIEWTKFLADVPPGIEMEVEGMVNPVGGSGILWPQLEFYCEACLGVQRSYSSSGANLNSMASPTTATYTCIRCASPTKQFFLRLRTNHTTAQPFRGIAIKMGEWPLFKPRIPTKLRNLLGGEFELFQKGRSAEGAGMGIGAFSYYRRVVENQRTKIFGRIKAVAEVQGNTELAEQLTRAMAERQFEKGVDQVKSALPEVLRIKGHNPLTLLHRALSQGLHAESDGRCLELAHSIRALLAELAERVHVALQDDAEIRQAIDALTNQK